MLFSPWLSSFAKRSLAQWSALSGPPDIGALGGALGNGVVCRLRSWNRG